MKKSFISAILVYKKDYDENQDAYENWDNFAYNDYNTWSLWDVTDECNPILVLKYAREERIEAFLQGCTYLSSQIEFDERNILLYDDYDDIIIKDQYDNIISY